MIINKYIMMNINTRLSDLQYVYYGNKIIGEINKITFESSIYINLEINIYDEYVTLYYMLRPSSLCYENKKSKFKLVDYYYIGTIGYRG